MNQEIEKVKLVEVPIEKFFLFKDQIQIKKVAKNLREGLSYRFIQNFLEPSKQIVIVCTPTYALEEIEIVQGKIDLFDGKGFIKAIPKEGVDYIEAEQSGMRSALIKWKGKQYRLKGCGNENSGFTLRKFEGDIDGIQEIRGCCFEHTVRRELFMCRQLEKIFQNYNIEIGNRSIGYWQYGDIEQVNELLEQSIINEVPIIPKFCGIYETLGDYRLGTHLLQGLRILTNEILETWNLDDIKNLINVESRIVLNRKSAHGNSWDLNNTQYCERVVGSILKEDDYSQDRVFDWDKEKQNIKITENLPQNSMLQNISYLYQRLGYEIGKIKRIMIDHNINWGYFRDHSKYFYHSNAHLDNFLILQYSSNLLAPVDFDLSFYKEEFINIDYDFDSYSKQQPLEENKLYGKFDIDQWLFYQDQERIGLELAISGIDMILASQMFVHKINNDVQEFFEILLRDQMRIGYLEGFMLQEDSSYFYKRMESIQQIISKALNFTKHIRS